MFKLAISTNFFEYNLKQKHNNVRVVCFHRKYARIFIEIRKYAQIANNINVAQLNRSTFGCFDVRRAHIHVPYDSLSFPQVVTPSENIACGFLFVQMKIKAVEVHDFQMNRLANKYTFLFTTLGNESENQDRKNKRNKSRIGTEKNITIMMSLNNQLINKIGYIRNEGF